MIKMMAKWCMALLGAGAILLAGTAMVSADCTTDIQWPTSVAQVSRDVFVGTYRGNTEDGNRGRWDIDRVLAGTVSDRAVPA